MNSMEKMDGGRIAVVSNIIDLAYGTLPAPFFIYTMKKKGGGEKKISHEMQQEDEEDKVQMTAPEMMMRKVPGAVMVLLSLCLVVGVGWWILFTDFFKSSTAWYGQQNTLLTSDGASGGFNTFVKEYGLLLEEYRITDYQVNFLVAFVICVSFHWLVFLFHGLPYESEMLFDLTGQVALVTVYAFSLGVAQRKGVTAGFHMRQVRTTCLAFAGSLRLGSFLFFRWLEKRQDFRFLEARRKHGYLFFTWTAQAIWCFLQCMTILVLNYKILSSSDARTEQLTTTQYSDKLGVVVFLLGFVLESVADTQKRAFQGRYPNREERPFIDVGLWWFSRHPNYCGETLIWAGTFLSSLGSFTTLDEVFLALVSPVFSAVFLMQTSLPWIEFLADKQYGGKDSKQAEEYRRYKARTSAYWILPKRPQWI